jgi:chemotaxis protein histidine kinase CheA
MPSPEVLAVLADEMAEAATTMAEALSDFGGDPGLVSEAIERYREQVERIDGATELLGLSGLKRLCGQLDTNLTALAESGVGDAQRRLLSKWPALVIGYLRAPKDGVYSRELVEHFSSGDWPVPLDAVDAAGLIDELAAIGRDLPDESEVPSRPTIAQPEDVLLDIPADVNPALVESFLVEAPLQAGAYTSLVEHVISGGAGPETLNEARRLVHSIKGAANTVGVRGVAALTHHLEDLLEYLGQRSVTPQDAVAKLLIDAADCLEMMLESLVDAEAPPAQSLAVLQRLLDAANAIDRGERIESVTAAAPVPAALVANVTEPERRAAVPASRVPDEIKRSVRVAATAIEEMLRLSGEMTIGRAHIQERLHRAFALTTELRDHHQLLQNRAADLDSMVTVQGIAAGQKRDAAGQASSSLFDALEMDQYSELHGAMHGFVETIADVQTLSTRMLDTLAAIETAVTQQGLMNNELHEQIMRSRMVPASTIEPRFLRTVRQVCDATGKKAQLRFSGGDVMLDDHVVNDLISPIMHLLRNAVDHGIESQAGRATAGKPEVGTIRLTFARDGNHIVILCEDDGAGLDLPRIRATAQERGLISSDIELNAIETARLILLPGFSTSASVSEVSGRGVGLDVVNNGIRKLKGTLDIHTEPGSGCRFTLRLPMTLGTGHCLLVRSAGVLTAIPTDVLDRVVYGGAQHIERLGSRWIFREERESCEVYDLAQLLGYSTERRLGEPGDTRPAVVFNDTDGKKAVIVDTLLSGRDLVIKNLGRRLAGTKGVIGASLLGDGQIVPVLDLHDLMRLSRGEVASVARPFPVSAPAARTRVVDVLVVDDSLSVRQALSQLLEDDGYQVHTAKDGVEALELLAKTRPAAMLVDLEMPRMNGLELTAKLRAHSETSSIPVIMVTSRSSDKHRQQAQLAGVDLYLTKPYREGDLLTRLRSMLNKAA